MPRSASSGQLSQAIGRGDVDLDVGLDVEHEPPHRGVRVGIVLYGYELAYPLAQVVDVGEEQRSVIAIEHAPGIVRASG